MEQIEGYILHRRHYRETSLILEVFSKEHGRLAILCRGAKKRKSLNYNLRPFTPIQFYLTEIRELCFLNQAETLQKGFSLQGHPLLAGLYLNELLLRVLQKNEPMDVLYQLYKDTLESVSCGRNLALYIRQFEYYLLMELGYALQLQLDNKGGEIKKNFFYLFHPEEGFTPVQNHLQRKDVYSGETLQKISQWDLNDLSIQKSAKKILSSALRPLIGDKPLMSIQLLKQQQALLAGVSE